MTPAPASEPTPNTGLDQRIGFALTKIRAGEVVAFPTDTLYALGADALNDAAVARVFAIKNRLLSNPLPLFVAGLTMAESIAQTTDIAIILARRFWPGALTLVVPKRPDFHSLALAGGDTVALRAPNHPVALSLISALERPLTATSANLSGGPDPDSAFEVERQLGAALDYIL